MVHLWINR